MVVGFAAQGSALPALRVVELALVEDDAQSRHEHKVDARSDSEVVLSSADSTLHERTHRLGVAEQPLSPELAREHSNSLSVERDLGVRHEPVPLHDERDGFSGLCEGDFELGAPCCQLTLESHQRRTRPLLVRAEEGRTRVAAARERPLQRALVGRGDLEERGAIHVGDACGQLRLQHRGTRPASAVEQRLTLDVLEPERLAGRAEQRRACVIRHVKRLLLSGQRLRRSPPRWHSTPSPGTRGWSACRGCSRG